MLSGKSGSFLQKAMEFLVKLGESFEAKRMIDISYSYTGISMNWGNYRDLQEAADSKVKVKIPTTCWIYGLEVAAKAQKEVNISPENFEKVRHVSELCKQFGIIPVNTCAPYLVDSMDRNPFGLHIASLESSAITYYNTMWGTRTNRDSLSAFFGAFTGRYPEYGYHLEENRLGKYLFDVKADLRHATDFSRLGYYIGTIVGGDVPVISGIKNAKLEELKALCCAMSTGGSVTLGHVVGITPEARTLSMAFGGRKPEETIQVSTKELKLVDEQLSDEQGDVDFVCLGCPHYSIHGLKKVSELLKGEKVKEDVKVWIMTAPSTYEMAKLSGYARIIEDSGATILSTCPTVSPGIPGPTYSHTHPEYTVGNVATDSAKLARYSNCNLNSRKVFLGSTERCVKAAVSGEWGCENAN
jgi:predicted aconitase